MGDQVRREFIRDTVEQRLILKLAFSCPDVRALKQHLIAPLLQRHIVIVRHPVISVNNKPLCKQWLGEIKAEKTAVPVMRMRFKKSSFVLQLVTWTRQHVGTQFHFDLQRFNFFFERPVFFHL